MTTDVYITRIAARLPNAPVSNDEMESVLGMAGGRPSLVRKRVLRSTGIQSRYYAIDPRTGESTHTNASLTAEAIRLLGGNGFDLEQIELLACGTATSDQFVPNHAVMVHGELAIPPCEVVATAGICLSGLMALKYATLAVRSGEFQRAVATGSETVSKFLRARFFPPDSGPDEGTVRARRESRFEREFLRWMLSDGAGAVLVEPRPAEHGISLRVDWILERSYANEMAACMYAGAVKQPDGSLKSWTEFEPHQLFEESIMTVKQDVKQLHAHIAHYTLVRGLGEVKCLKGLQAHEVDHFLPHYSSEYFRKKHQAGLREADFEIPDERFSIPVVSRPGSACCASSPRAAAFPPVSCC
jgi:3-oxoacyl-[acyl-carrier-protein] synthase-3